jgi:hypothetical protein
MGFAFGKVIFLFVFCVIVAAVLLFLSLAPFAKKIGGKTKKVSKKLHEELTREDENEEDAK